MSSSFTQQRLSPAGGGQNCSSKGELVIFTHDRCTVPYNMYYTAVFSFNVVNHKFS
jgi:hypothetical protein